MKNESTDWRTDLLIFTGKYSFTLRQLACQLNRIRQNQSEMPRCRVFLYCRLSNRLINTHTQQQMILIDEKYRLDFQIDRKRSKRLYRQIRHYEYIDSVNIIAEGYPIFSFYDFILKTDMDVFLTRPFAKYYPRTDQTLLVGRGDYSTSFNTNRLRRIARDMSWNYQNITNIGSTWSVTCTMKYLVILSNR
jgi:hypothetical protein